MTIQQLIAKQRAFYKSIVSVQSPILGEAVHFTAEGFNHLLYESNRKPRSLAEQWMKLHCLDEVPEVLKNCKQISKTRAFQKKVKGKLKQGVYYELACAVQSGGEIRVIIERVGTGKFKFLSVMPHHKKKSNKKRP